MSLETLYILSAIFVIAWLFQVIHYLYVMGSFNRFKNPSDPGSTPPVSVVICAKNEADNLRDFLPSILTQEYPVFQVVVVNDCSTDNTELVLAEMKNEYKNLYYTSIPFDKKFFHGKKLALTLGIKAAKYKHLVLTDADCYPASNKWLTIMASSFTNDKKIVLGYGTYEKKRGLLNLMIRYETFWNAIQYFGFSLSLRPFMGVGRNIAYEKKMFNNSSQYKNNLMLASGDDDLFIVDVAKRENTTICYTPDSHTISVPPSTFSEWSAQKSRHLTTSVYYPFLVKGWLFFEPLTRQILWLFTLCSIIFSILAPVTGGLFAVHLFIKFFILNEAGKKLHEKRLFWAVLLFDWLLPILTGILWISNLLRPKRIKWK